MTTPIAKILDPQCPAEEGVFVSFGVTPDGSTHVLCQRGGWGHFNMPSERVVEHVPEWRRPGHETRLLLMLMAGTLALGGRETQ